MKVKSYYIGGQCPTQLEGWLEDGRALYVRFRNGKLTWGVGNNHNNAHTDSTKKPPILYAGDGGDGHLTLESIKKLVPELDFSAAYRTIGSDEIQD